MKRKIYESPEVELFEVTLEQTILSTAGGSVQKMNDVNGTWDDDDF